MALFYYLFDISDFVTYAPPKQNNWIRMERISKKGSFGENNSYPLNLLQSFTIINAGPLGEKDLQKKGDLWR